MHIIKISPVSFKIILSKEDLQRHGVENILHHPDISGEFFSEIIEKTNELYRNPFTEGTIDAEFFESKDGGGELFISRHKEFHDRQTYLLSTGSFESIIQLCKRLYKTGAVSDSGLYYENGTYFLTAVCNMESSLTASIISEYGLCKKIGKIKLWHIQEHAKTLIKSNAAQTISEKF